MLQPSNDYDTLYRQFRWQIPAQYNIGVDVCDRWAASEPTRTAIVNVHPDGRVEEITYRRLRETSNRLANVLRAHGIARGDRVVILLPQAPEAAAAHVAIYKLAAVALPLALLFGVDAIAYRLQNSGAKAVITNAQGLAKLAEIRDQAPDVKLVLSLDGSGGRRAGFCRGAGESLVRIRAGSHLARRSGDDDLHLGHDGPAEGRAACPSRAARPSAGRRDAARFLSAAGRSFLDAGRLGLGRRTARCAVAVAASRRAGGRAQVRQVRSGGSLRPDGPACACAMPSFRRPRCACCARRQIRAGVTISSCARWDRAANRSARKPTNGARRPSVSPSTSSTARPNAISCSPPAPCSVSRGPAPSASRCPVTSSP